MNEIEIVENWLSSFARNIPNDVLDNHVLGDCNFLWHIFTWGKVACLAGDEARAAFDKQKYKSAIMFCNGYSRNGVPQIDKLDLIEKIDASKLEETDDVYVVDRNFRWTYVHTHEEQCGPYFCEKETE